MTTQTTPPPLTNEQLAECISDNADYCLRHGGDVDRDIQTALEELVVARGSIEGLKVNLRAMEKRSDLLATALTESVEERDKQRAELANTILKLISANAEIEALRANDARYRALFDKRCESGPVGLYRIGDFDEPYSKEWFDAAIDAQLAIAAQEPAHE